MKIFENIFNKFGYTKRSGTSNPEQWLIDWVSGGAETSAGVKVNQNSALKYTPFWAAVRIISGTVASLPFMVYRRSEAGKERAINHPVYRLLHDRPNEFMDALTFVETRQAQVLCYGNGYAEIQRDGGGRPIALWPLLPNQTQRKITDTGIPYYEVRPTKGETVYLPDYNVLHIKGLGFDGYTGYDVVSYHKEAIGYGMGVKKFGSRFFGNGAFPGGVLEHPASLSDDARKRLEASWQFEQGGLTKAHRIRVLEEGLKFVKQGIDPEQAQALETQKYNVDDCSRIFNIPPHKLASLDKATFSNIEELNIEFVTQTMLYWFRKWEQECNYKLFMPSEQQNMFCEILVDGLLRGNITSRYAAYNIGRNAGFLSVNDIREKENMNSIGEDGDIYLEPLNMKPAGTEDPKSEPIKPAADNKPDGNKPKDENSIRQAHKDLIMNQWLRIIIKKNNSIQKGVKDDFYENHRAWAMTVLYDATNAYASTQGRKEKEVRELLSDLINKHIQKGVQIEINDAAVLAGMIIDKLGVKNNG